MSARASSYLEEDTLAPLSRVLYHLLQPLPRPLPLPQPLPQPLPVPSLRFDKRGGEEEEEDP